MNTNEKVAQGLERINQLVAEGMSQEEAMKTVLEEAMKPVAKRTMIADRITWISELTNLAELEKAIRIAYAKKCKAKGKPETEAKYQKEIEAGQARKNDLIALINGSEDRVGKAIELGMDPSKLLQDLIADLESDVSATIAEKAEAKSITKKAQKDMMGIVPTSIHPTIETKLSGLGKEFLDRYNERQGNGDQRIISLNKKFHMADMLDSFVPAAPATKEVEKVEPKVDTKEDKKDTGKGNKGKDGKGKNDTIKVVVPDDLTEQ